MHRCVSGIGPSWQVCVSVSGMKLPTHHISSPADLLALVPTVLGFHPEDSLVLIVTDGKLGAMHARVDLPCDDDEAMAEVVETLLGATTRASARQVALVAYSDDELVAEDLVDKLSDELRGRAIEVVCAVRADGERWFSLDPDTVCCPEEGVPYDLASHPITAQSVLEGRVTYARRSELAESLIGTDFDATEAVTGAADEAVRRLRAASVNPLGVDSQEGARAHLLAEACWVRERVRRYVRSGEPLEDIEVGRLVVAVVNVEVRDVAWAEMTRADAPRHVELWRDVVRRTPHDLVPAPAALLAFAAWLAGEGALAWCAVERCQEVEPDYSMAGLVSQALAAAMHPSVWQRIPPEDLPLFAG